MGAMYQKLAFSLGRGIALREGIKKALDMEVGDEGRRWVVERFSNAVVAKKLLEALSA